MTNSITVSALEPSDIPGAVECIQAAFADDPYANWVFDKEAPYFLDRNRVSLRIRCEWGIKAALFYVAKDASAGTEEERNKVLGVACWLKPKAQGEKDTWNEWFQTWLLWGKQVAMNLYYNRAGLNAKRYYIWKDAQAEAQNELWTDPSGYYFCNIVTVHPRTQGKGVGKRLFKTVTDMADKEGVKCYLESSKDVPNTAIYERLGFRKAKEMECNDDGVICKLFCMIRDPQPPGQESRPNADQYSSAFH